MEVKSMIKYIIMDLGDTLFKNVELDLTKGVTYIYNNYCNHNIEKDAVLKDFNLIWEYAYQKRDNDDFEINIHNYFNYLRYTIGFKTTYDNNFLEIEFLTHSTNTILMNDLVEFLSLCKTKNIHLVILSNSTFTKQGLIYQLKEHNIDSYFEAVFSSADYILRKPSPLFFNLAVNYLKKTYSNLKLEEVRFIGNDYHYDVLGSTNQGIKAIWFNEQKLPNPHLVECTEVKSYKELIKMMSEENETI